MTSNQNRAQLKHVLQDVGMKDKPKMLDLEAELGPLARLLFIDLISAMSGATMARISRNVAKVLGKRIGLSPEKTNEIIEYCLNRQMLSLEDDLLTNSRVIADQEKLYKQQERWRESKRKQKEPTEIPQGTPVEQARLSEELNIEELNNKKNGAIPIGLIKCPKFDFVYLTEFSQDAIKKRFRDEGLKNADITRAIELLDLDFTRNPEKQHPIRDHYKDLISWPLDVVKKKKLELERARGSPNGKPKEAPRPNRNTANF